MEWLAENNHYILIGAILLIAAVILIKIFQKKRQQKMEKTAAIIDKISLRRATINTEYIEKRLFDIINRTVASKYYQDPFGIPQAEMVEELYQTLYADMKREYDLGIRRTINHYEMRNPRVIKQDNSSMYAVTHIVVKADFLVDYIYYHPTCKKHISKQFTQHFVFVNANGTWLLEKMKKEEDVKMVENFLD